MPVGEVVRTFCDRGHHAFVLPHLEMWLMHKKTLTEMAREDLSKQAFDLHLKVLETSTDDRHVQEHKFRYEIS